VGPRAGLDGTQVTPFQVGWESAACCARLVLMSKRGILCFMTGQYACVSPAVTL